MRFTGPRTADALANDQQPTMELFAELLAYVREHVDPEASRITGTATLDRPLDTSQQPHRSWFQVSYE